MFWFHLAVLVVSAGTSCSLQLFASSMDRYVIDSDETAVCNDGSPATYYFSNGDPSNWLIYLEGGGWCYDEETCSSRYSTTPERMSSLSYPANITKKGVFSSDDSMSPMSLATKVFIKYCSSDGWAGDVGSSNEEWDTFGWSFRGRRIIDATLQHLQDNHGLGNTAGSVMFGGTSAGGRGAMFNIDRVSSSLQTSAPMLSVVALLDSPYWVDMQPLYSELIPMQNQTDQIRVLANISGSDMLNKDCMSDHSSELWKCLYGQFRVPYLNTRFLLYAASFDAYQLNQLIGHTPESEAELVYSENFAALTQQLLHTVPTTQYSSVYSQACYNHAITTTPLFDITKTNSATTQNDALVLFIENPESTLKDIDNCTSFICGSGCLL